MRVYIGIDAGWESMRYEVRNARKERIERGCIAATPEALEQLLKKYEKVKEVQVAFESGTQMYWMDAVVKKLGDGELSLSCGALLRDREIEEQDG